VKLREPPRDFDVRLVHPDHEALVEVVVDLLVHGADDGLGVVPEVLARDPAGEVEQLVAVAVPDPCTLGARHDEVGGRDAARDEAFWTQVCNARVSDRVGDAPLLRINEVHHSIAMFPTDRSGIQHINHQVESADDVMRSFRFLKERQVRIVFGPGRHPSSSAKFLYFEGPDGMVFEYSSGVKMIADELLYRERQLTFDPAGFCEWGAKPDVPEFRS